MVERIWQTDRLEKPEMTGKVVKAEFKDYENEEDGSVSTVLKMEIDTGTGAVRYASVRYSVRPNSGWAHFLKALEAMGLKIKDEQDLIGLEAHWKQEQLEFGTDRKTGKKITSQVWLPSAVGKGKKEPALAAATPESRPADVESFILGQVSKKAMPIVDIYTEGTKLGYKKLEMLNVVNALEKAGKVIYEDGVVAKAQ